MMQINAATETGSIDGTVQLSGGESGLGSSHDDVKAANELESASQENGRFKGSASLDQPKTGSQAAGYTEFAKHIANENSQTLHQISYSIHWFYSEKTTSVESS